MRRRCFTASFGGDVKPSVPGDLARLASGYSRPSLATTIVVDPKGYVTKKKKKSHVHKCTRILADMHRQPVLFTSVVTEAESQSRQVLKKWLL